MFNIGEWAWSDWFATVLDKEDLHNDGDEDDTDEEGIVEESLEYVVLKCTKFSGVNFIEDLHKHESIEDQSIVLGLFSWDIALCAVFNIEWSVLIICKSEDLFSSE